MVTKTGCSIIIFNPNNPAFVLIGQRSARKPSFPGHRELIGGTMEADEQPEECIRREAAEELGTTIDGLETTGTTVSYRDGKRYIVFNFTGSIDGAVRLLEQELAEIRWVTAGELVAFHFYPGCREKLESYFRNLKGE